MGPSALALVPDMEMQNNREKGIKMKRLWFALLMVVLLAAVSLPAISCYSDDDDDDDNDDAGDDDDTGDDDTGDDDTGDDDSGDSEPPTITDTADLEDTGDETGPYVVSADVDDNEGVDAVSLFYRVDGGDFAEVDMAAKAPETYEGEIPGQVVGSLIEYYVWATDAAENEATDPADAPASLYGFQILVTEILADDDGTVENGYSVFGLFGDGSMMVKMLTPSVYPSTLVDITVGLSKNASPLSYEIVVLEDETGGSPDDATQVWTTGVIDTEPPTWPGTEFYTFDVAADITDAELAAGNWLVGIVFHSGGIYILADTDFPGADSNCLYYDPVTATWGEMGTLSLTGTLMGRATAIHH